MKKMRVSFEGWITLGEGALAAVRGKQIKASTEKGLTRDGRPRKRRSSVDTLRFQLEQLRKREASIEKAIAEQAQKLHPIAEQKQERATNFVTI